MRKEDQWTLGLISVIAVALVAVAIKVMIGWIFGV